MYSHQKFVLTSDTHISGSKKYYRYSDVYRYFETVDTSVQRGKTYFYRTDAGYGESSYFEYTQIPAAIATIDRAMADVKNRVGSEVYERLFVGHQVSEATDVVAGTPIDEDLYEITASSYSQDESFSMPNNNEVWSAAGSTCKSCIKIIEPEDGVLAWLGNIDLTQYAVKQGVCAHCDDNNYAVATSHGDSSGEFANLPVKLQIGMFDRKIQSLIDIKAIKALTIQMFDRVTGTYPVVNAPAFVIDNDTVAARAMLDAWDLGYADITIKYDQSSGSMYGTKYDNVVEEGVTTSKYEFNTEQATERFIAIKLDTFFGTFSINNSRFDLRQIRFHF